MHKAVNNRSLWGAVALSLAVLFAAAQTAPRPAPIQLNDLQGYWEGEGAGGPCSITINGNSLHYRAGKNWHKTTFSLPPGTNPQQLHATIIDSFPPSKDSIGQVVPAIIKIEDGTLTLAAYSLSEDPPKTFADAPTKYVVKKVPPKEKNSNPSKTK